MREINKYDYFLYPIKMNDPTVQDILDNEVDDADLDARIARTILPDKTIVIIGNIAYKREINWDLVDIGWHDTGNYYIGTYVADQSINFIEWSYLDDEQDFIMRNMSVKLLLRNATKSARNI